MFPFLACHGSSFNPEQAPKFYTYLRCGPGGNSHVLLLGKSGFVENTSYFRRANQARQISFFIDRISINALSIRIGNPSAVVISVFSTFVFSKGSLTVHILSLLHHYTWCWCEVKQGDWAVLNNSQFIKYLNYKCPQRALFIASEIWVAFSLENFQFLL